MDDGPHGGFVDTETERKRANEHADFVRHPPLLIAFPSLRVHLAVVGNRGDSIFFEEVDGLFYAPNRRSVHNHVALGLRSHGSEQQVRLRLPLALFDDVAEVGPRKARDALVGFAEPKRIDYVVADSLGGARGEGSDREVRELGSQPAELPVLGAKLMSPLGNAMRFVDSEKRNRNAMEPLDRTSARQALRREIEKAESAFHCILNRKRLLLGGLRAIQYRRFDAHLGKLPHLSLHKRDK